MLWIIDNWFIVIAIFVIFAIVVFTIYKFAELPTKDQKSKIKEWLLLAVAQAEKDLGGGTGALKLKIVYDLFITKFPVTAQIVSYKTFRLWVDEALDKMKELLIENETKKAVVKNE
jgi:uncharacterized membrane protein YsdA (DUF1294 family)